MENKTKKKFNLGDAIGRSWNIIIKNFWFFVVLALISSVISELPNIINKHTNNILFPFNILFSFLVTASFWLISAYISIGITRISLKFIDGKKTSYDDLFSDGKVFWNYILASILYGLLVFAGLILLVVPGIIWGIKYQFYSYYIIDEGLGPVEALTKSGELTSGVKWDLFILAIVFIGIIILGAIALGVGLLVAIPVAWLAAAFVFRSLQGKINSSPKKVKE